mgnify:CR=1 FL=1
MKLNMYAIFDSAVGAYMRPFFLQADGQAQRMFSDMASDAEHEVGRHPEDYSLCRIGVWDDENAETAVEAVTTIITGLEAVAASRKVNSQRVLELNKEIEGGKNNSR